MVSRSWRWLPVVLQIAGIGNDEIHPRHILPGEYAAEVDDDDVVLIFKYRQGFYAWRLFSFDTPQTFYRQFPSEVFENHDFYRKICILLH